MGQSIEKAIEEAMAAPHCGGCLYWRPVRPLADRRGRCNFPMPACVVECELMRRDEGAECPHFTKKGNPS